MVRAAQITHGKSVSLKKPLAAVASRLMPAGFLEDQTKNLVKQLAKFTETSKFAQRPLYVCICLFASVCLYLCIHAHMSVCVCLRLRLFVVSLF